jgi:hypothetical protein
LFSGRVRFFNFQFSILKRRNSLGGLYYDERAFGGWRPLRSSDEALEPQDEEVHLREAQRIYIIDLQKTLKLFKEASGFIANLASQG